MRPDQLPRKVDDLRGLRVARWVRESQAKQGDKYGPGAQRAMQDRAIDRYGLVDTDPGARAQCGYGVCSVADVAGHPHFGSRSWGGDRPPPSERHDHDIDHDCDQVERMEGQAERD